MFFRSLTFFRFPVQQDLTALEEQVQHALLRPVGPLEMCTRGFISPFGREEQDATFVHRYSDFIWLTLGSEEKLLPASVLNDMLARQYAELEQTQGRRPSGRDRVQLKEALLHELMPKALVKQARIDAMIDLCHGYIAIDSSSRKLAETLISEIRGVLGSFPALPLSAEAIPRAILTGWIAGQPLPEPMELGYECELKDPVDQASVVKCQNHALRSEEIDKHLEAGKQVSKLALRLGEDIAFVLGDDLVVRKLKFLDDVLNQLDDTGPDNRRMELDTQFVLMTAQIRRLFLLIQSQFKVSQIDAPDLSQNRSAA